MVHVEMDHGAWLFRSGMRMAWRMVRQARARARRAAEDEL